MNINPINNPSCINKTNLTTSASKKALSPFVFENPKTDKHNIIEYEKEYIANILSALNKRQDELYDYLDSVVDDDGLSFTDKLLNMFDTENAEIKEDDFIHKTPYENIEILQKNGFNPEKINRTEYGPGFYVGFTEGTVSIYSGAKMQVKYKGNSVKGKNLSKYNSIKSEMVNKLREYLNLKSDFSNPLIWKEFEAFSKFANEYSRKVISDKLGIDGAFANKSDGYFVIFNPDSVREIKSLDSDY